MRQTERERERESQCTAKNIGRNGNKKFEMAWSFNENGTKKIPSEVIRSDCVAFLFLDIFSC
jgi:hypothetical protein